MFSVKIDGLGETRKMLQTLAKQVNYASAVALTRTAKEVQGAEIGHIRSAFTVRGSWLREGGKFSVGIIPASKDNLAAVVENRAPWLEDHEEGKTRQPHGKHFAIPQAAVRRTKTDLIQRSQRPRALKRSFVLTSKAKGIPMLFARVGRGKGSYLKFIYKLVPRAKIAPDLRFVQTARDTVARVWKAIFEGELVKAIRTARWG